ncbi:MAG: hypothetical protein PHX18_08755 [Candidatus Gastranaerophilales bacterium]|nr:hypothetical protein [Candidatus Gastranaerophilales bacterium]
MIIQKVSPVSSAKNSNIKAISSQPLVNMRSSQDSVSFGIRLKITDFGKMLLEALGKDINKIIKHVKDPALKAETGTISDFGKGDKIKVTQAVFSNRLKIIRCNWLIGSDGDATYPLDMVKKMSERDIAREILSASKISGNPTNPYFGM